ncbi:GTP 3',8-cyclase [Microbulbifer sp. NBRC 101763]|uniref:radical SAM/SPASM domain-containing protein n=1 Tax=Microbulbifer sp. NBRC 101763 TaxID=1113820 RepID=UPI003099CD40
MSIWPLRKLQLEIVNKCNFRCPLCRTLDRDDGVVRRKITVNELKIIIEPIQHDLEEVTLYGTRGEPFVHKNLEEIVSYLKSNTQAKVIISTNGSLADKKRTKKLLELGLDDLIFAIDGTTQDVFSQYRVGGDLEEILTNLKDCCDSKKSIQANTRIIWQYIPMSTNLHQIDDAKQIAKSLGVDILILKYSSSVARSKEYKVGEELYPLAKQSDTQHCPSGLDKLYVDPNGDCFPCCYAEGYIGMRLGNAFSTSISEIWNSGELWEIRRSFVEQKGFSEFCKKTCLTKARKKKKMIYGSV